MLSTYPRRGGPEATGGNYRAPSRAAKPENLTTAPEDNAPSSPVERLFPPEIRRRTRELQERTRTNARRQNEWLRQEFGFTFDLIDTETGALDMRAFNTNHSGPYSSHEEATHRNRVTKLERIFADVENPDSSTEMTPEARTENETRFERRRAHKMDQYRISAHDSEEEINRRLLKNFYEERKFKETTHLELAVMNVLADIVGEDFLVVRSAAYDDYVNGIDTVIIDKKTGTIVCTLDEVKGLTLPRHEENDSERSAREQHKKRITLHDNVRGGRRLEYGLTFKTDPTTNQRTAVRGRVEHLPILYISVLSHELDQTAKAMRSRSRGAAEPKIQREELAFFDRLIGQLETQALELATRPNVNPQMQQRGKELLDSIERMQTLRIRKFGTPQRV